MHHFTSTVSPGFAWSSCSGYFQELGGPDSGARVPGEHVAPHTCSHCLVVQMNSPPQGLRSLGRVGVPLGCPASLQGNGKIAH